MRRALLSLAAVLAACSDFTTTDAGVAQIVVFAPVPPEVEVAGSVTVRAVALDADGDTLDIPIYWRALDTTIAVDSVQGLLTGLSAGKTGKVVARALDLYSAVATFTVIPQADTLIVVGDSVVTVVPDTNISPPITVRVEAGEPPAAVDKRRVTFELISPVFATLEDRTVEFSNRQLAQSIATTTTGHRMRIQRDAPSSARVRPGKPSMPPGSCWKTASKRGAIPEVAPTSETAAQRMMSKAHR